MITATGSITLTQQHIKIETEEQANFYGYSIGSIIPIPTLTMINNPFDLNGEIKKNDE